jgi:GDPmannose 4,6-dehydratase
VIGTGKTHSGGSWSRWRFGHLGLDWAEARGHRSVVCAPAEVELLLADASKAKNELGWSPKVGFEELVKMMVDADLERLGT